VLETVHLFDEGPMPAGVAVSAEGRVFVSLPLAKGSADASTVEIRDGAAVPFPPGDDAAEFRSVRRIVVDPADRLWVLDAGGPRLVGVDLGRDAVVQTITFDPSIASPATCLNDVRFDLRRCSDGIAYLTDFSGRGPNGLVVVDLALGEAWRRLHEHPSTKAEAGSAGPARRISVSADGARVYYRTSGSGRWHSVCAAALADRDISDAEVAATVADEDDRGDASDDRGRHYLTGDQGDAILRRLPDGTTETLVRDSRLRWPEVAAIADGYLYVIAKDEGRGSLLRIPIDAGPVRLML
jgi:sugar lactone lactonase YvrE